MKLTKKVFDKIVAPGLRAKFANESWTESFIEKANATFQKQDGSEIDVLATTEEGEPVPQVVEAVSIVLADAVSEVAEDTPEPDSELTQRHIESAVKKAFSEMEPAPLAGKRPGAVASSSSKTIPAHVRRVRAKNFVTDSEGSAEYKACRFGQFISWSVRGSKSAGQWLVKEGLITKDMSEGTNSAGGFTVPDPLSDDLIRLVEEYGVLRQNAMVVPMTSDTLKIPRRSGGLTVQYPAEGAAITESDLTFAQVALTAFKAATLTAISSELTEDAVISIGDLMAKEIAQAFALAEDTNGFTGDGTGTFGGVTGIIEFEGAGSRVAAAAGNTTFGTLDLSDFHNVTGKLPAYALANAKWYISSQGFSESMERLAHAQGGVTRSETEEGMRLSFLGYPVERTQVLPTAPSVGTAAVVFGDLSQGVVFGDRRDIQIQTSEHYFFNQDQIAVRGTERYDIQCHTFDDASVAGPVIVLNVAAA